MTRKKKLVKIVQLKAPYRFSLQKTHLIIHDLITNKGEADSIDMKITSIILKSLVKLHKNDSTNNSQQYINND